MYPSHMAFLSKFRDQFGEQVWPSLLLLHVGAPPTCYTAEAVTSFRDIISLSVVPYARSSRLRFDKASNLAYTNIFQFYPWMLFDKTSNLAYTNTFQFYPWMLDKRYEDMCPRVKPAILAPFLSNDADFGRGDRQ